MCENFRNAVTLLGSEHFNGGYCVQFSSGCNVLVFKCRKHENGDSMFCFSNLSKERLKERLFEYKKTNRNYVGLLEKVLQ